MNGVIFTETLRRSWKQIVWWGGSMAVLGFYIAVVVPTMDTLKQYADLMASMPTAVFKLLGVNDAAAIATPEGFISFSYFGYALLILAVWAVWAGMNITANEEDEGILDVVLALPVPRWRVVVEKFAAYALIAVGIALISLPGLVLGLNNSALKISTPKLVASTVNLIPGLLLMLALTAFVGAWARRKSTALAVTSTIIVASYFADFIGRNGSGLLNDVLRALSFFSYYDSMGVMTNGLNGGNVLLLLLLAALLVVGSVWCFQRRDVGV